ncbi:MAG: hypothetical protein AAFZ52_07620 [Bacteroidota bacterium]
MTVQLDAQSRLRKQAGPRAEQRLPLEELDLSAEQKAELKTLRQDTRAKMQQLRTESAGQRPDRTSAQSILASSRQAMLDILTPEQRTQLESLIAERKAKLENVDKEALKADLKAHRAEVKAVVRAARSQLDDFISTEDQAAIERLRGVMKTRPKGRGQDRAAQQEWRTTHEADLTELKTLTEEYANDIKRIREKLEPQVKEWKAEKREILESYFPDAPTAKPNKRRQRTEKAQKGAAFLLMKG